MPECERTCDLGTLVVRCFIPADIRDTRSQCIVLQGKRFGFRPEGEILEITPYQGERAKSDFTDFMDDSLTFCLGDQSGPAFGSHRDSTNQLTTSC